MKTMRYISLGEVLHVPPTAFLPLFSKSQIQLLYET